MMGNSPPIRLSMLLLYAVALFQLALLALVLRLFWRNRAMKKRQDALVAGLQGQRYWRINMARQPFFQRWLRVLPFEAKGVLIDEGAQLRIKGFWLHSAKAFDVVVDKSQCQVEWLGNRSLRAGNLYWAELGTERWRLLFCADTGMYALPSREALADIFRSVFPKLPLDQAQTTDFALEKNPRSLVAVCLFLALLLFALLDSFVFNHFELVDAPALKGAWPLLTKTNIGYGEAIASTHMAHRNRVAPTFSATQAANGWTQNWIMATKNRHSRISDRGRSNC